jgi:hypothetical protein
VNSDPRKGSRSGRSPSCSPPGSHCSTRRCSRLGFWPVSWSYPQASFWLGQHRLQFATCRPHEYACSNRPWLLNSIGAPLVPSPMPSSVLGQYRSPYPYPHSPGNFPSRSRFVNSPVSQHTDRHHAILKRNAILSTRCRMFTL